MESYSMSTHTLRKNEVSANSLSLFIPNVGPITLTLPPRMVPLIKSYETICKFVNYKVLSKSKGISI